MHWGHGGSALARGSGPPNQAMEVYNCSVLVSLEFRCSIAVLISWRVQVEVSPFSIESALDAIDFPKTVFRGVDHAFVRSTPYSVPMSNYMHTYMYAGTFSYCWTLNITWDYKIALEFPAQVH
ncbi:hypothetical protein PCH_Pc21g09960 [Penicillium rubens Wisconsin 54-1255]|uniref:Uncharacterized protein n=1 Tax=Penicillium rubens (strain ATCC 28089 / DSM 1075 / NRRL 1951 / Wisconsin 54-1255) TaxID=500485 RepID=B6HI15_PENRW|nr:hypothetical protein PCH_Pc21g09960 [Penicillium rubens Wisconsin 54-1255]